MGSNAGVSTSSATGRWHSWAFHQPLPLLQSHASNAVWGCGDGEYVQNAQPLPYVLPHKGIMDALHPLR